MKRKSPEFKIVVPFEIKEREVKKVKDLQLPDWVKQVGMDDDLEVFEFKGYASTFGNVDHGDDVVMSGAFLDTIQAIKNSGDPLPILWQHEMDQPIGIFVDLFEDEKGLFVHGIMPKSDEFVEKRVMPQMQIGAVRKMSIGFSITKFEWDGDIRKLIKLHLWETSLVTIPMNSQADVTEVKTVVPFQDLPLVSRDRSWDSGQAVSRVRAFTGSDDEATADYRKAFLWFDDAAPEQFGSYKLPIADVIDGRMFAVPRAIFAAAAAMAGARGGVDIPEGDRQGVISNINRYYEKMGLESPFQREESSFRADDIESMDARTLENLFRSGICFSKEMSKRIVSLFKSDSGRDVLSSGRSDAEKRLAEAVESLKNRGNSELQNRLETAITKLKGGQNG